MSIRWHMDINDSARKKLSKVHAIGAMEESMRETFRELRDRCVLEAPGPGRSRTPNPTGNLRRNHIYEVTNTGGSINAILKNTARSKNGEHYWIFLQYGTSRMEADPYLTRALDAVNPEQKIVEKFKKRMGEYK